VVAVTEVLTYDEGIAWDLNQRRTIARSSGHAHSHVLGARPNSV